jgi:hypothetical protein
VSKSIFSDVGRVGRATSAVGYAVMLAPTVGECIRTST